MIGYKILEETMRHKCVLLDTSFFVRLLNDEEELHKNALGYYRYFLEKDTILKISTISIAEYCVRGEITDLPLKDLQILPFNQIHATQTGKFADVIFRQKKILAEQLHPRPIIPNDSKLFAQADIDQNIDAFITSDTRSKKTLNLLKTEMEPRFEIIDISTSHANTYGILDFGDH